MKIRRSTRRKKKRKYKKVNIFKLGLICLILICSKSLIVSYNNYQNNKALEVRLLSRSEEIEYIEDTFTVCIDPGHGDWDVGAIGIGGSYEKDIVLDIALILGELLETEGINVIYTRNNDELTWSDNSTENLYERVRICEDNNSDIFISIHCNSAGDSSEYKGVETWYNNKSYNSELLASTIQEELSKIDYTEDRGIKFYDEDEPLAVLNNNSVPAALIELGFISNWLDEDYLTSDYGQTTIAKAIFNAVINYKNSI